MILHIKKIIHEQTLYRHFKAYKDFEDPVWRLYDDAFQEKMAATGCRKWVMDIQLFQEFCGGHSRNRQITADAAVKVPGPVKKLREDQHPSVFFGNSMRAGTCTYGRGCKFPHLCELCLGVHPKSRCLKWRGLLDEFSSSSYVNRWCHSLLIGHSYIIIAECAIPLVWSSVTFLLHYGILVGPWGLPWFYVVAYSFCMFGYGGYGWD